MKLAQKREVDVTIVVHKVIEHGVLLVVERAGPCGGDVFSLVKRLHGFGIGARHVDIKQVARHEDRIGVVPSLGQNLLRNLVGIGHVGHVFRCAASREHDAYDGHKNVDVVFHNDKSIIVLFVFQVQN